MAQWIGGSSTGTSGAAGTTPTLGIYAGAVAGVNLILGITNRDGTTDPLTVTDDDSGGNTWSKVVHQNASSNGSIEVWHKRATSGTASKTITITGGTGSVSAVCAGFSGVSLQADPWGTPVGEANASGNEAQAGVTTTRANSLILVFVGCTSNDLDPTSFSAFSGTPSVFSEIAFGDSTTGSDCSITLASGFVDAAGITTDTISWTQVNGTGASVAFELLGIRTLVATDDINNNFFETGTAATLKVDRRVAAGNGFFFEPDFNPASLRHNRRIAAESGSFAETGTAADLIYTPNTGYTLEVDSGTFAETGTAADLEYDRLVGAGSGTFAETGTTTDLEYGRLVGADSGTFAETGTAATLSHGYSIVAGSGTFTETGTAATLKINHLVSAESGTFTETGTAAGLHRGYPVVADSGVFTEVGTSATLKVDYKLDADSGTYAEAGTAATLKVGHYLGADSGTFVETGTDADLVYGQVGVYTLSANSGTFTETGTAASLKVGYRAAADSAAFVESGATAGLRVNRRVGADAAVLTETGATADLKCGRRITTDAGTLNETGSSADLRMNRRLELSSGALSHTGSSATLNYGGGASEAYTLSALGGVFSARGNANLNWSGHPRVNRSNGVTPFPTGERPSQVSLIGRTSEVIILGRRATLETS